MGCSWWRLKVEQPGWVSGELRESWPSSQPNHPPNSGSPHFRHGRARASKGVVCKAQRPPRGRAPFGRPPWRLACPSRRGSIVARRKEGNHIRSSSLNFMYYSFACVHKTLPVTPAMEADVSEHALVPGRNGCTLRKTALTADRDGLAYPTGKTKYRTGRKLLGCESGPRKGAVVCVESPCKSAMSMKRDVPGLSLRLPRISNLHW